MDENVYEPPDLEFCTDLTLEKVVIELRDVSAADWFSLGQNLGIKLPKLREIEKDHPGDVRRCKTEVLDWWYRNAPVPSWESLAHALLRTGGYHGLAERLRKKGAKRTGRSCLQRLEVVVCGKVHTGKSSLINSLARAKEDQSLEYHLNLNVFQTKVTINEQTFDVLLWDSPGLGGPFGNNEEILQQVVEMAKSKDLLVYCLDMHRSLEQDDVDGIVQLTRHLGKEIWRNAVFALTYANGVNPPLYSIKGKIQFFQQSLLKWEADIKRVLQSKITLSADEISRVAIVPVGYHNDPPPDRSDWLTPFWRKVLRIKGEQKSLLEGIQSTVSDNWRHYIPDRSDWLTPFWRKALRTKGEQKSLLEEIQSTVSASVLVGVVLFALLVIFGLSIVFLPFLIFFVLLFLCACVYYCAFR